MKNFKKLFIFMVLNLFFCCVYANTNIQAQVLIESKLEHQNFNKICKQLGIKCIDDQTKLYSVRGNNDAYYLIDSTPSIYRLKNMGSEFVLLDQWNFKDYPHSHASPVHEGELQRNGLKIFPALYPLNKNEIAVAIIDDWFIGYSGGGRHEQYADFVQLDKNGKYKLAISYVLFYSSEMIRACFSQQEYITSPHGHDEAGTMLNIKFLDTGLNYFRWILNYKDYSWASHTSEKKKIIKKYSEMIIPFQNSN